MKRKKGVISIDVITFNIERFGLYCQFCGDEKVPTSRQRGYWKKTGEPIYEIYLVCSRIICKIRSFFNDVETVILSRVSEKTMKEWVSGLMLDEYIKYEADD